MEFLPPSELRFAHLNSEGLDKLMSKHYLILIFFNPITKEGTAVIWSLKFLISPILSVNMHHLCNQEKIIKTE